MNIKTGSEVRTKQDLQNVITSCVFNYDRSKGYNELLFSVCSRLAGSQFENDLELVLDMIHDTRQSLSKFKRTVFRT